MSDDLGPILTIANPKFICPKCGIVEEFLQIGIEGLEGLYCMKCICKIVKLLIPEIKPVEKETP